MAILDHHQTSTTGDGVGSGQDASDGASETDGLRARIRALEAENARLACRVDEGRPLLSALRESEARYRTILDSEPACVKLVARDGRLLSMNPAGLEMIEAESEAQVAGLCVFDLVRPPDRAAFIAMHERVFAGETARLEFEIEGLRGARRQMETFAAPLAGDDGAIVAQLAVTHDITQRKHEQQELHAYRQQLEALVAERSAEAERARAQARRNERLAALGTLAAGIAHELNNPLGTIMLGAELAQTAAEREERNAALDRIRSDVERCNRIVKGMLQFGRDEPIDMQKVSISEIVRDASQHLLRELSRRGIAVEFELADRLPLVAADPTAIGQVVLNLVQNAAIASPDGSRIRIHTHADDDHVFCAVEDSGRGMDDEVRARAFDPFFTTRLREGGTGLGLSISHGIVTEHRGALEIAHSSPNGTRVVFALPRLDAAPSGM